MKRITEHLIFECPNGTDATGTVAMPSWAASTRFAPSNRVG